MGEMEGKERWEERGRGGGRRGEGEGGEGEKGKCEEKRD